MKNISEDFGQLITSYIPWYKSLRFRLTATLIIVSLVMGIVMMIFLSNVYQNRIDTEYKTRASSISTITASLLHGETIDHYMSTLQRDDEYDRFLEILSIKQRETNVAYIVISIITEDGEIFIFDTDEDERTHLKLGEIVSLDNIGYSDFILSQYLTGAKVEPFIHETVWGRLLTAADPIYRQDGSVAAHASVSIYMDNILQERRFAFALLGIAILLVFSLSVMSNLYIIRKFIISPVDKLVKALGAYHPNTALHEGFIQAGTNKTNHKFSQDSEFGILEHSLMDMKSRIDSNLLRLREAEEQTKIMLDTTPLCCQLWNTEFRTIDCNEAAVRLFGFKNKQEYIERYFECSPEYQSDGRRSDEAAISLVKKAFEQGHCTFEWMHQMPDSTPLPSEVTLVRVSYKGGYVVAAYTRDLRDIDNMERQIIWLKTEAEKIYYDALTGIYNRRYFDENLNHLIKSLSRSNGILSLIMIDLDYFKEYNDTYGHMEGDECLKTIAQTLSKNITRADDFVARYGGEEFVVVLPNTDESGAFLVAEKLLSIIRDSKIPHIGSKVKDHVTASIGVTTGKTYHTQDAEVYIKKADRMMYLSKQNGRNRYTYESL